jgi:capsular polysaccharide biosynthesis protein
LKNRLKKLLGYIPAPSFCDTTEKIATDFYGIYKSNPVKTEFNDFNLISNILFRENFQKKYSITNYENKFKAIIPNALIFGYGAVISPDGISLARDVTPDFGADSSSHWILKRSAMWKRPRNLEGKILVAIHNLSKTYYHWLFEEIPRVLGSANDFEIALVSGATRAQKDVARLISEKKLINKKLLFPNGYETFRCKQLVVPSLPDRCKGEMFFDENRPSADTISTLREFAFSIPSIRVSKNKKIFISRKNAKRRRLLNEEQIISQLMGIGFQVFELEEMGFLQ